MNTTTNLMNLTNGFTQKSPGFGFVHVQIEVGVDCACVEQHSKNDVTRHHAVEFPVDISDVQTGHTSDDERLQIMPPHTTIRD